MRKITFRSLLVLVASLTLVAAACSDDSSSSTASGETGSTGSGAEGVCATADTSAGDALAQVCESGTLRVATDPKYKPQSWYDVQTSEWNGFDVDVAKEIASRLGRGRGDPGAEMGRDHRRVVERPVGRERGVDDRHDRPRGRSSTSRRPTTTRRR